MLRATVTVEAVVVGSIGEGLLVLLGVTTGDTEQDVAWMVEKIVNLRVFSDPAGKMNLSVRDRGGALLVVSQFTLYGDCSRGRRPSFDAAAPAGAGPEPVRVVLIPSARNRSVRGSRPVLGPHGCRVAK